MSSRYPTIHQLPNGRWESGQPRHKGERLPYKVFDLRGEAETYIDAFYKRVDAVQWVAPNDVLTFH